MRQFTDRPTLAASRRQLEAIVNDGLTTWLDLANILFVYMEGTTYALTQSIPNELREVNAILDTNKPYWRIERKMAPRALAYPLPESIIGALHVIVEQQLRDAHTWFSKNFSLRYAILMIMSHSLKEAPRAAASAAPADDDDNKVAYSRSGFIKDSESILEMIRFEFTHNQRRTRNYGMLHSGYVLESISALQYIVKNYASLASKRHLVDLRTDKGLDDVPYHAEQHRTNTSNLACLRFIVNSYISAFIYFQSQNKLHVFFSKLYGGNCIEGRLRNLLDAYTDHQSEKVKKSFRDELRAKAQQCAWLLISTGKTPSIAEISKTLYMIFQNESFKPDPTYVPNGKLTSLSCVERFAEDALRYDSRLAVADPDGKNGDIVTGISLFQAVIRGNHIRRDYTRNRKVPHPLSMSIPQQVLRAAMMTRSFFTQSAAANAQGALPNPQLVQRTSATLQKRSIVIPQHARDTLSEGYTMVPDFSLPGQ